MHFFNLVKKIITYIFIRKKYNKISFYILKRIYYRKEENKELIRLISIYLT